VDLARFASGILVEVTVNINAINGIINNTTVVGANMRPAIVNVGNGNLATLATLATLAGALSIILGTGVNDSVNISDSSTADSTFSFTSAQLIKTGGDYVLIDIGFYTHPLLRRMMCRVERRALEFTRAHRRLTCAGAKPPANRQSEFLRPSRRCRHRRTGW
jgi:hypothetical protein